MELDVDHIDLAARFAAHQLRTAGVARVRLSPGDATEYRLLLAAPGLEFSKAALYDMKGGFELAERAGTYFWVALCNSFGAGYEWHGGPVDAGYATEKWTNLSGPPGIREHTGRVVAEYLNAVFVHRKRFAIIDWLREQYQHIGIEGGSPMLRARVAEEFNLHSDSPIITDAILDHLDGQAAERLDYV